MEAPKIFNKQLSTGQYTAIVYGGGALIGVIAAAYLNPALSNNILQLAVGIVIIFASVYMLKSSNDLETGLQIAFGSAGLLFIIRGLLGFAPTLKAQLTSWTLGVI